MAVDEQHLRIRRSLEEKLGVEEASYLMDRPVGGWSELVTNHTLDLKFEVLDERFRAIDARFDAMDARFDAIAARLDATFDAFRHEMLAQMHRELRDQTWKMITAIVASIGAMSGLFAAAVLVA